MIHPHRDSIHPLPFLAEAKTYTRSAFRGDLQAGLTVAVFAIPQVIAYAILAGVPPIHGLYAAMVAGMVAALWGSSPFVNTGPTNSASLLTAAAIMPFMGSAHALQMVFLFTLLVGIIRLVMGMLRLGGLVHFVPESAFLGFTVGVGSMIALGRLHYLFGIEAGNQTWFPAATLDRLLRLSEANPHALLLSGLSLALLFGLNRYAKTFPVALMTMVAGVLYAQFVAPEGSLLLVRDIESVPTGLPGFTSPFYPGWTKHLATLAPSALAVALVGLIEAVSIGQTLAIRHRQHLNYNQEFFGQGLGMIVSSFFQGMPGSGSFSRSKLIEEAGGVTRFANIIFGFAMVLGVLTLPGLIQRIPAASLASLLLYIGIRLFNPPAIRRVIRTSAMDTTVLVGTFLVTLLVKIEYGIFTGIVLGALLLMQKTRILRLEEIQPASDGSFEDLAYTPGTRHTPSAMVALAVHGPLTYSVSHELREQLNEIVSEQQPEALVLRLRTAHFIDYSSWNALFEFAEQFHRQGGRLYLTDLDAASRKAIQGAGAHLWLPEAQLFPPSEHQLESFHRALRSAAEQLSNPETLSGRWQDWLEHPHPLAQEKLREIDRFLRGDSS